MLESLFSDIAIGPLKVPNRVVMPPMTTRFASEDGYVTDQTRAYYRERAKGGPGLIIFESTYPCERHPNRHLLVNDSYVEGLQSVVETVHNEGTNIALQMNPHRATADKLDPLAPSEITTPNGRKVPQITTERIEELILDFAAGAARAKRAGFDGLEIHGASGYIVHQFLSPRTNHRTDEYGGDGEGRTKFARDLLTAVREEVGKDFPVWFRMPGHEFLEGGIDPTESRRIARRLDEAGADALHVTAGHNWNSKHIVISGRDDRGTYTDLSANIKRAVDVPVIVVGRINDPELANEIVAEGKADLTAMGRAHIADPHIVRKAKQGNLQGIRRCVGGLEGCRDLVNGNPVTCTINPRVGREDEEAVSVDDPDEIAVVGGGPAGMETARWAARRGHDVTVFEEEGQIGGQLRWAQNAPGKSEYGPLLEFFQAELNRYGVDIKTATAVPLDNLDSLGADTVVVATGSETSVPNIKGISDAIAAGRVTTPRDVLSGNSSADESGVENAVVYGDTEIGIDTAEYLSEQGVSVTIVSPGMLLPERYTENEGVTAREHILEGVERNERIEALADASLSSVGGTEARVHYDGEERTVMFGLLVLAQDRHPRTERFDRDDSVVVIGDADTPRDLYTAIHEGADIGRSI